MHRKISRQENMTLAAPPHPLPLRDKSEERAGAGANYRNRKWEAKDFKLARVLRARE